MRKIHWRERTRGKHSSKRPWNSSRGISKYWRNPSNRITRFTGKDKRFANSLETISVYFPDGSSYHFKGYLNQFDPFGGVSWKICSYVVQFKRGK